MFADVTATATQYGKANASIAGGEIYLNGRHLPVATVVGFAFAGQKRLRPDGTIELRGGRANDAIAARLVKPGVLELPKILEFPLAVSYFARLARSPHLASRSGEVAVVSSRRELDSKGNISRVSASEVALQAAALIGTAPSFIEGDDRSSWPLTPIIPAALPWMMRRAHHDMSLAMSKLPEEALEQAPLVILDDFDRSAQWKEQLSVPMHDGEWINPWWWTSSEWLFRVLWNPLAYVRDLLHLSKEAQQHHWAGESVTDPNVVPKGNWRPSFESSLQALAREPEVSTLSTQ